MRADQVVELPDPCRIVWTDRRKAGVFQRKMAPRESLRSVYCAAATSAKPLYGPRARRIRSVTPVTRIRDPGHMLVKRIIVKRNCKVAITERRNSSPSLQRK